MKIVIQSINFHPELTGIGKYTGEMAGWLTSKGHLVRVITSAPYYPKWKISPGYKKYSWSKETWCDVEVWRCPIWVPIKPNGMTRIIHLASFALSSFPIMLWQIFWRPNIILTIEPPLFTAPAALVAARISGA
jgi:colanic acid biosynthesis glycosyl transferase WcaI